MYNRDPKYPGFRTSLFVGTRFDHVMTALFLDKGSNHQVNPSRAPGKRSSREEQAESHQARKTIATIYQRSMPCLWLDLLDGLPGDVTLQY